VLPFTSFYLIWTGAEERADVRLHNKIKSSSISKFLSCPQAHTVVPLCIDLFLFLFSRSLSCQRITLHKNLFFSFVCNSVVTIISLTAVANNQELVATNPVSESIFGNLVDLYVKTLRNVEEMRHE